MKLRLLLSKDIFSRPADVPIDFLFKALETGNNCDLNYKNSKNPRLIVELALIKMCRLNGNGNEPEKKKPEPLELPETDKKDR